MSVKHIEEPIGQRDRRQELQSVALVIDEKASDRQRAVLSNDLNNSIDLRDCDNNSMTMQNVFNADPDGSDGNQQQYYNVLWVQDGDQMG